MGTEGPKGLLVVYTGDGKGKTTAALGAVFRALGRGWQPAVVQYIKGKWETGERLYAESIPGLVFHVMGRGFTWESEDISLDSRAATEAWRESQRLILSGAHQLVVLDELTYALNYGFFPLQEVLDTLASRPKHVHVIVTGRSAPAALVEKADLVTEMRSIRHPYDQGVPAQLGLDF